jgi:hypothetical protein
VTTVRISRPMGGRPSPDVFGNQFDIASPLQDQVGNITSLQYVATTPVLHSRQGFRVTPTSPILFRRVRIYAEGCGAKALSLRREWVSRPPLRVQPRCHTRHDRRSSTQLQSAIRFAQTAAAVFRIAPASCCPEAETFSLIALKLHRADHEPLGADTRNPQSIIPTRRRRSRSDYLAGVLRAEQTSMFWGIAFGSCIQNA